mgnify:CR=1 FL=1
MARGHVGRDAGVWPPPGDDDGTFPGEEPRSLQVAQAAQAFGLGQVPDHEGKGFGHPAFAFPQGGDGLVIAGVGGQMKAAQPLERQGEPDPLYIKELALDIATNGLLQTPVARNTGETIQLAFGHNRLAAYKWLNDVKDHSNILGDYSEMPLDIRVLTDEQMALIVCAKKEQFCTCLAGAQQRAKVEELGAATVEELKEAAKEARREKRQAKKDQELLAQETAERIATGLVMKNRDTWWRLICELSYNSGAKREENDLWNLQVAVGMAIVDKHLPYDPLDMVERMNELLKKCGLEPLGEMTAARLQEIASRELAEREIL